jgi:hypothetical protein
VAIAFQKRLDPYILFNIFSYSSVEVQVQDTSCQYVEVSSPIWDLWPDITSCPQVVIWKLLTCVCGAPSLTRIFQKQISNNMFYVAHQKVDLFPPSCERRCTYTVGPLRTSWFQSLDDWSGDWMAPED